MSDDQTWSAPEAPTPPPASVAAPAVEKVGPGLLAASAAIVGGFLLTAVLWRIGFVASFTSYVIAAGAVVLYLKGAGAAPRKGLIPLIVLILLGVVVSFYGAYLSDLMQAYSTLELDKAGVSRMQFWRDNVFVSQWLTDNGLSAAIFFGFAALGAWRTLSGLVAHHRAQRRG